MPGFVFKLLPPRPDFAMTMSDEEQATMQQHVAYWQDLMAKGQVLALGPVADPAGPYGIGIILADDLAAAEAMRDRDPAVLSTHGLRGEVTPMLRLVTPTGVYE